MKVSSEERERESEDAVFNLECVPPELQFLGARRSPVVRYPCECLVFLMQPGVKLAPERFPIGPMLAHL